MLTPAQALPRSTMGAHQRSTHNPARSKSMPEPGPFLLTWMDIRQTVCERVQGVFLSLEMKSDLF